jgi:hypothetical protein
MKISVASGTRSIRALDLDHRTSSGPNGVVDPTHQAGASLSIAVGRFPATSAASTMTGSASGPTRSYHRAGRSIWRNCPFWPTPTPCGGHTDNYRQTCLDQASCHHPFTLRDLGGWVLRGAVAGKRWRHEGPWPTRPSGGRAGRRNSRRRHTRRGRVAPRIPDNIAVVGPLSCEDDEHDHGS